MGSRKPKLSPSLTASLVAAWRQRPDCLTRGSDFIRQSTALADVRETVSKAALVENQVVLEATISIIPDAVPSVAFLTAAVMMLYTDNDLWGMVVVKDHYGWALLQALASRRLLSTLRRPT